MKDILNEIVDCKRRENEHLGRLFDGRELRAMVDRQCRDTPPSLARAVAESDTGIIAEFKRKSPSKGWIKADGSASTIPLAYQNAGAAAISILTDERFFGGRDEYVAMARRSGVTVPILYKNFVVDESQLFRARLCGASAVLLIAACLDMAQCAGLMRTAHDIGLEVLLEMHSEAELEYAALGPDLCGINNRNLGTFNTDVAASLALAPLLPGDAVKVSESGIGSADTVAVLQHRVADADTIPLLHRLPAASAADSVATADSIAASNRQTMLEMTSAPDIREEPVPADSLQNAVDVKRWVPNPTKATWLALVIPGGGQIYNRKFWKLPIFYGGFAGCAYALTWNNKMYNDYSDAYRAAVNEEWNSSSITDLLPPGYVGNISHSQLTETLRKRKDTYRRYRDMSIFAFIGVYLLSVVDAYVDAELSNFDITPDLSMKVEPAVMDVKMEGFSAKTSVGVQCSLCF